MPSAPYASFLDSATDLGGQSHAAWNENGVLLHAVWDPVAGRWGDAAQIANATAARNIQLTPGRSTGSAPRPLLLASWESGEANNADLFLSVGFYEGDGRVVWSDLLPIRANGQADRNHRVVVAPDGAFLISNEVRQDPGDQQSLDASYQDSEIATTVLRVTRRTSVSDGLREKAAAGERIAIRTLGSGERLLRVQANGQWFSLEPDSSRELPRLGLLQRDGSALFFTPNGDFAKDKGSVQFSFETVGANNVLRRSSFEVFAGDAPPLQAFRIELAEPGAAFETQPIAFSQAINRERITRDAFASLVPRRGGSGSFRELAGDGLFGDRAGRAVARRLNAAAAPLLAQAGVASAGGDAGSGAEGGGDGVTAASPLVGELANAAAVRYQQTYAQSFVGGDGIKGVFFDRYELSPNLPIAWNITFADISKSVDGALIPLGRIGEKLGENFRIALTGSTAYVKPTGKGTVGYRSRLSLVFGNAIQTGDVLGKDRRLSDRLVPANKGAFVQWRDNKRR